MRSLKQALKVFFALSAAVSLYVGCGGSSHSSPPPPVAPAITTQPANQTVLEGATATFTVAASGTAPLTYQWKKGGTAVTGATSASYTTPATVLADSGSSFTVTVTNAAGNVTSSAATLTVNPAPPTITTQPASATVTAGATATFTVVASGTAPLSYQWNLGGTAITGATSASYTTPATTLADNGSSFTVTVTNAQGTVTSSAAVLTVQAAPVFTTQPVGTTTVLAGTSVTFTAAATGNPAPTFQWYKGTTLLTGQTAATLTIASPTLADAGSYTVVATNSLGSVTSSAAVLIVNQAPIFTTQPASLTVVAPAAASFTAAASGFPVPTYQWQKGGVAISGATSATYSIPTTSLSDAATYTCVATNSIGTATSNGAVLTIQVPPAITTQPTGTTVTAGASASFTVVATGTPAPTYQWQKNNVNISGATSATYAIASTTLGDAGAYTVVVTNPAGTVTSAAAVLTVNAPPVITAQPANQSVVVGQTATFSVTATGNPTPTYQWRKGGVAIGGATGSTYTTPVTVIGDSGSTFDVVVTNSLGTVTSTAATLTVNPAPVVPTITTQPLSQTVAAGASVTFTVVATGTPTPTYQWYKDSVAISGATSSSYTIAAVAATDAGVYAVSATNSQGTITSSGATLTVLYAPVITTQPASQTVVQGSNVTFSVTANGNPSPTYQWRFNTANISGATGSTYTINGVAPAAGGSYDVVVTNSQGSVTSTAATLTVTLNYLVSGRVTLVNNGPGVSGVTVSINTTPTATTAVTDGGGYYTLNNIPNGTYTVTPSLVAPGVSAGFLPASSSVAVSGANVTANFQAAIGYSVSGTVNYSGTKTGRVYLALNGNGNTYGVSIAGPTGAYTIRGVPPGTYTLTAYMDTVGLGVQNAENPVATVTGLGVTSAPVTGVSVNLADPAAVTLSTAPSFQGIVPFSGGAFVNYGPLTDLSGVETANAYDVQWSTDSSFATGVGTLTFKAQGNQNPMCFTGGLTNGSTYYFRIRGKAGTATISPWSAATSLVIGSATGFNTVSGTITLPVAATGPLAVALVDKANNKFFIVSIPKASITNLTPTYSLTGVPNGTYGLYAILDQNHNGVIDPGDITNTNGNGLPVTVSANVSGVNLTLSGANATAVLNTSHWKQGTNEGYQLNFAVNGNVQLPVNVAVQFGPNAIVDVGVRNQGTPYQFWMPWIRPVVNDPYPVTVAYGNGTPTDTLTTTVTGVVDAFAQNLAPQSPTSAGTTPTFTWTAPVAPPTPYTYELGIWPQGVGGSLWWINNLPSTTTSILYNSDGSASGPLVTGTAYTWTVNVVDQFGNSAQMQVNYTP